VVEAAAVQEDDGVAVATAVDERDRLSPVSLTRETDMTTKVS